jgi:hypothetical protein
VSHRTQITLSDGQYARLKRRSRESGASIAELVRQAVDATYSELSTEEKIAAVRESAGAWKDRDFADGLEYVERIRGPGLGERLKQLGL